LPSLLQAERWLGKKRWLATGCDAWQLAGYDAGSAIHWLNRWLSAICWLNHWLNHWLWRFTIRWL